MPVEGWAVEIRGQEKELDFVRNHLSADPQIQIYHRNGQAIHLAQYSAWNSCGNLGEFMDDARNFIERLNGILILHNPNSHRIEPGVALKFASTGEELPITISGELKITLEADTLTAHIDIGGSPGGLARPTFLEKALLRSEHDDSIFSMLIYLARNGNWFDLYNAMECIERLIGGEKAAQVREVQWKKIRQTANRYRHAPSEKYPLPNDPPTLEHSRTVVMNLARNILF
jgi:hypothetical protein